MSIITVPPLTAYPTGMVSTANNPLFRTLIFTGTLAASGLAIPGDIMLTGDKSYSAAGMILKSSIDTPS